MYNTKKFFIPTVIITLIAAALRIYTGLYVINPVNGKYEQPIWQWIMIGIAVAGGIIAIWCCTARFTAFSVSLDNSKGLNRFFIVLLSIVFGFLTFYSLFETIAGRGIFGIILFVFSAFSFAVFIYFASRGSQFSGDTVYILSIGPFGYFTVRIIFTFNIFSRNISLFPLRYELLGLCSLLLFYVFFIKSIVSKTPSRAAMTFAQTTFFFLITFSIPQIILLFLKHAAFAECSSISYIVTDFLFAVSALYFGSKIKLNCSTKH